MSNTHIYRRIKVESLVGARYSANNDKQTRHHRTWSGNLADNLIGQFGCLAPIVFDHVNSSAIRTTARRRGRRGVGGMEKVSIMLIVPLLTTICDRKGQDSVADLQSGALTTWHVCPVPLLVCYPESVSSLALWIASSMLQGALLADPSIPHMIMLC